jgi:hypothetical protein
MCGPADLFDKRRSKKRLPILHKAGVAVAGSTAKIVIDSFVMSSVSLMIQGYVARTPRSLRDS